MPDLGNYATEVLLAYAVSIALLIGIVLVSWRGAKKSVAALAAVEDQNNG